MIRLPDRSTFGCLLISIALAGSPLHAAGSSPASPPPPGLRLQVQNGSRYSIDALQVSPQGKLIVSTSAAGSSVNVWDIRTGKLVRTIETGNRTGTVTFSSGGMTVFVGSYPNVNEWDIAGGTLLRSYRGITGITNTIAVSSTGKRIAAGESNGFITVWDTSTAEVPVSRIPGMANGATVTTLRFFRDGIGLLAGYSDGRLILWNLSTGARVSTIRENAGRIDSIDLSADERHIVCLSKKKPVEMWDIPSNSLARTYSLDDVDVSSICFSSNGASIFGATMNGIAVWESATGRMTGMFQSMEVMPWTTAVACVPDANIVAAATQAGSKLDFLDVRNGTVIRSIDVTHASGWHYMELSPSWDGKSVFASSNDGPLLWSTSEARLSWTAQSRSSTDIFSSISPSSLSDYSWIVRTPDEKAAVMVRETDQEGQIELRRLENGELTLRFEGTTDHDMGIVSIAIAPDGRWLAAGTSTGTVRVWDISTGKIASDVRAEGGEENGAITALAFSANGNEIFAGTGLGLVQAWDIAGGRLIRTIGSKDGVLINCLVASPDSRTILIGKSYGGAELWDASTGSLVRVFGNRYDGITCAQFSPDGRFALVGSESGLLISCDPSREELRQYHGHEGRVSGIAFSPDGAAAYSVGEDGTIRRWDLATGTWVAFLLHRNRRDWLVFTDDGYWDGSSGCSDMLAMVNGLDVYTIDQFAPRNNRPDIILQRLGSADANLIEHFHMQSLKRLRRLDLTEKQLSFDLTDVPEARIASTSQDGRALIVTVKLDGKKSGMKNWNLWVNDVPLFGAAGRALDGSFQERTETVLLNPGDNKIEAGCMNVKGIDAFRASANVRWEGDVEPRLYYLGFGISKYKNPDLELGFAAIDAQDLADLYQGMKGRGYSQVIARTWTDIEVTPENIKKAKQLLADARPEDTYVLFIAGHGVHDQDSESTYYYVTHDTDIDDLPRTAANFDLIEDLMQGVAPRNKLFLMDTCESGEMEDAEAMQGAADGARGIRSRGLLRERAGSTAVTSSVTEAITHKDRWIYNDIVRRSGAVVFSSCRGNEASWEFEDLKNGAFTSAIKSCFADAEADNDHDGLISLPEIKSYVAERTRQLVYDRVIYSGVHEEQHPTVDRDNLSARFDFPQETR